MIGGRATAPVVRIVVTVLGTSMHNMISNRHRTTSIDEATAPSVRICHYVDRRPWSDLDVDK